MVLAALLQRSLSRVWAMIAGLSLLVSGLQVMIVLVARSQEESRSYDMIANLAPRFIQRQFGDALPAFLSFGGMVTFAYFDPVVLLMVAVLAVFVASELAADIEYGHVDLLLARGMTRRAIVTRSLVAMMLVVVGVAAAMVVAGYLALQAFAPPGARWPTAATVLNLAGHLVVLAWCFGAIGLAVAAFARRRLTATGVVGIAAVFLYLLEFLGNAWRPAQWAAVVSPFHYTHGAAIVAGQANSTQDFLVLGSVTVVATAIAYWRYSVRDV
jgi:ABC-type transport system involved in multi-copper enzyme maturation permease subunit